MLSLYHTLLEDKPVVFSGSTVNDLNCVMTLTYDHLLLVRSYLIRHKQLHAWLHHILINSSWNKQSNKIVTLLSPDIWSHIPADDCDNIMRILLSLSKTLDRNRPEDVEYHHYMIEILKNYPNRLDSIMNEWIDAWKYHDFFDAHLYQKHYSFFHSQEFITKISNVKTTPNLEFIKHFLDIEYISESVEIMANYMKVYLYNLESIERLTI